MNSKKRPPTLAGAQLKTMPSTRWGNFNNHAVALWWFVVLLVQFIRITKLLSVFTSNRSITKTGNGWLHHIHINLCCERLEHRSLPMQAISTTPKFSRRRGICAQGLYPYRPTMAPPGRAGVINSIRQHLNRHVVCNPCNIPLFQSSDSTLGIACSRHPLRWYSLFGQVHLSLFLLPCVVRPCRGCWSPCCLLRSH